MAGRLRIDERVTAARVSGAFLPLSEGVEADEWEIETTLACGSPSLSGERPPSKLATTTVTLHSVAGRLASSRGPFRLTLETAVGFYHGVASAAIPDGDVLRVTVDPHSLRHVDGRARP